LTTSNLIKIDILTGSCLNVGSLGDIFSSIQFDKNGNLLVAASLRGRRGIVKISADGSEAEMFVAGMNLVGLAFNSTGDLGIASTDAVYSLSLQY